MTMDIPKILKLLISLMLMVTANSMYAQRLLPDNKYIAPDTTLAGIDSMKLEIAKKQITDFITYLSKGNQVDGLVKLCQLPFAWDRNKVLSTTDELKEAFAKVIIEKGGNRQINIDSIFAIATRQQIIDKVVPIHCYYMIAAINTVHNNEIKKARILFSVQITNDVLISGFTD
jgi:hypothetical protein